MIGKNSYRLFELVKTREKYLGRLVQVRYHSNLLQGKHRAASSLANPVEKQQTQQHVESWEVNLSGVDETALQGKRGDWWWTGKKPEELVGPAGILHSLPQPTLQSVTEGDVKRYFDNTWTLTEVLFSGLQGEEPFYRPPYHHLRHPMIFYYGHTACFYTNKLNVAGLTKSINPYFEEIFEVGVDEMRWDDMSKNAMEWPTVGEVRDYRKEVYEMVSDTISEHTSRSGNLKVNQDHPLWALYMAFEHDRIHLETSSVLFRELPIHLLRKPEHWPGLHPSTAHFSKAMKVADPIRGVDFPSNEMVNVPGMDQVTVGKYDDFPTFGWDNEYGARTVDVPDFQASKFMVSNGEFYEFVADGGYRDRKYWTEDGWGWRSFRHAKKPYFWVQAGPSGSHQYRLRTIFEEVDMPWSWPVNVNKHEATAFCNWKAAKQGKPGLRLVTEAEHLVLRDPAQRPPLQNPNQDPALKFGGKEITKEAGVNLNLAYGSESPVDAHPANSNGFHDVTGNAWEWSEDDFNPLNGFEIHPFYDDFSTPCFDGEHNMILGGSFISSGDAGANLHCRYHFRPHFLQHSGFRYVQPSRMEAYPGEGIAHKMKPPPKKQQAAEQLQQREEAQTAATDDNVYEQQKTVHQYLALHYGQNDQVVDQTIRPTRTRPEEALNFPKRCADLVVNLSKENNVPLGDALDLGCAVGGSSFELAKSFRNVTGIDFSHSFIRVAQSIQAAPHSPIEFQVPVEGNIRRSVSTRLASGFDYRNINFHQGDACALDTSKQYDAVLMANLLCRLPDPVVCLESLAQIVRPGGIVVTVSPFSWLHNFTEESKWLQQGEVPSDQALEKIMTSLQFTAIYSQDMPLLIRDHERKYEYIVSQAQAFIRKQ